MTRAAAPPARTTAPAYRPAQETSLATALGVLIRGNSSARETVRSSLRLINAGWLTVIASLALCLVSVHAIDIAENLRPETSTQIAPQAAKQLVFAIVGMLAATMIALPHTRVFGWLAWPALVVCVGLLVFVLIPFVPTWLVRPRNGARAWIDLGPMDLQPSELTKIAYVLVVAHYLRFRSEHRTLRGLVVPGIITAVPVGLITLEPDLGTASLFVPALFAMLIAAGARKRHLTMIVLAAALAAPAAYPFLKDHQKQRIVGLVKQMQGDRSTASDINFQSYTAQTLIGSGMTTGNGDATARALVHYNHLPEAHNDMIFSVIAARYGFLGGLGVFGLYLLWVVGALLTAATTKDPLGRLLAVGLAAFVAAQFVVNVGMNIGLLPIVGITLPFLSYGGSSLVTSWLMTGLVMGVALHRSRFRFRESFEWDDEGSQRLPGGLRAVAFQGRAVSR